MRVAFYQDGLDATTALATGLLALTQFYGDFECPEGSAKSLGRMLGALEYYAEQYPLATDAATPSHLPGGKRGIEFSFAEPLPILHPETGNPLIYCGRMDGVMDYAGGRYGLDDKTTSQLGASWSKQWDMRGQFTGYCWGAEQAGLPLSGFLIRGVSIMKTKYDTQQALTYRPDWMIDRWFYQLIRDLERMIECWESGVWDYDLSEACNEFGGCQFKRVCLSKEPQGWLETGFVRRRWDPVAREEVLLGDL
jgi:hypothetical protein